MVHTNKVLTVSYGTFSCTLEGFDDSFGTMKAIAEYFRDLASDDRYFGAEPPQPDVEMLARIAQREIARQVEGHSTGTGRIVLRATEAVQTAVVTTPEPAAEPAADPEAASVTVPEAQVTEAATPKAASQTDIAKGETPEPADIIAVPEQESVAAPELIEATAEAADAAEDVASDTPEQAKTDPIVPAPDLDAGAGQEPAPIELVAEVVSAPEVVPAEDSIAAKLQRIRAVVSQNDSLDQVDDYTEDQHAEAGQDASQSLDEDEEILATPDDQDADSNISAVLNRLDASHADKAMDDTETGVKTNAESSDTLFATADQTGNDPLSNGGELSGTGTETDDDFFTQATTDDDSALFEAHDDAENAASDAEPGDDAQLDVPGGDVPGGTGPEQDTAPIQARVVKVKRADLEAAIASGQLVQADDANTDVLPEKEANSLSPEDEADLMRELAAVEDELADGTDGTDNIFGADITSEVAEDPEQEAAPHAEMSQIVSEDEADLSRLMAAAEEKLEDPEASSERETYSHLRAAVAAAEAERSDGGNVDDPSDDDAYRDDLANIVRPRRPTIDASRTTRRVIETRPAPLKLVAEQRVDDGAGLAQRGPVRPRRVMATPVASGTSDATGVDSAFAEFADRMGATELPDLLEAAAAYLSFVEGHEKFSRPQLMNKVRLIQQDDYNREDGLRSFGQLLRDGKIEKRGGGRFAASDAIGFRSDKREAG